MQKILFIVNSDSFFVSHRLPIAIEAQKLGFQVHILSVLSKECKEIHKYNFRIFSLDLKKTSTNPFNFSFSFLRVLQVIYKVKPDIIHLITVKPIIWGGLASKLFKQKALIASVTGLGQIYSSKNIISRILKKIIEILYKVSYSNKENKYFIFQNKYDKKYIQNLINISDENITMTNGAGVNLNFYQPSSLPKGTTRVLFASRLLKAKGTLDFIKAAKLVTNAQFLLAGEYDSQNRDSIKGSILQEAIQEGIIKYIGFVSDIRELISESSIVVLPSYYGEGLPKVLIEAAATGRPIITTNTPGCKDSIIDGVSGYLVDIKSPDQIASKVNYLIENPQKMIEMGIEARKLAEIKFDIKEVINKHMMLYQSLIT